MCLCAGAVFVENRYRLGLAPTHWRLKPQVSKNKQCWLLFAAAGPGGGKTYQLLDIILPFLSRCTHTHSHAHIFWTATKLTKNWINLNRWQVEWTSSISTILLQFQTCTIAQKMKGHVGSQRAFPLFPRKEREGSLLREGMWSSACMGERRQKHRGTAEIRRSHEIWTLLRISVRTYKILHFSRRL